MKILNLRLKNMIGIKKGVGVDEINIDLSKTSGLIALSGKNGAGKSSVLENLQPYARLASRDGALQHHFFGKNGEKELIFEFNGDRYKTLIKIDAESGRTEGYVWKNDTSEVDGKISNYNKYIKELIGSPDLFFNSSFCSQNSKKLNELTTGKLKELFSEFLRLDKLIEYEDTSKQCANLLAGEKDRTRADIEQLNQQVDRYGNPAKVLAAAKTHQVIVEQSIKESEQVLEKLANQLSSIQADIQKNELLRAEKDNIGKDINRFSAGIEKDIQQEKKELDALRQRHRSAADDILEMESLLANENEIREAAEQAEIFLSTIEVQKSALYDMGKACISAVHATSAKKAEHQAISMEVEKKLNDNNNQCNLLQLKLNSAKIAAADLDKRDPSCESTTCSFIVRALASQKDISELEQKLPKCSTTDNEIKKAYSDILKRLKTETKAFKKSEIDLKSKQESLSLEIAKKEQELIPIKKLARELPMVSQAKIRKEGAENQKKEITDEGIRIKEIWAKRIAEQQEQKAKAEVSLFDVSEKIDDTLEVNSAPVIVQMKEIKSFIVKSMDDLVSMASEIALSEKDISAQKHDREKIANKEKKLCAITSEQVDWQYIKDACGKNGLRALEIDSVAPVITTYANDLLFSTFGPAFTIRFRTQDDEGREILEIVAIGEDGAETPLDFLSGGQKVWLLKALRLSMTLISKQKSGAEFLSGFADELDGPLDIDRAVEFIQMYRAFMTAGGFESFYFISHKPECQALADHRIVFGGGRITNND